MLMQIPERERASSAPHNASPSSFFSPQYSINIFVKTKIARRDSMVFFTSTAVQSAAHATGRFKKDGKMSKSRKQHALRKLVLAVGTSGILTRSQLLHASSLTYDAAPGTGPATSQLIWDLSIPNWYNGANDQVWPNDPTTAVFGNAALSAGIVQLEQPMTAGALIFNPSSSGNYTLTGAPLSLLGGTIQVNSASPTISTSLGGPDGLTISGTGSVTLTSSNFYNGPTLISSGSLIAASPGAIPNIGAPVTVNAPGTLVFSSSSSLPGTVANYGAINISAGQTVFDYGQSFNQESGVLTVNGSLGVAGTFNDDGGTVSGTVTLNGSNATLNLGQGVAGGTFLLAPLGSALISSTIPAGVSVIFQPALNAQLNTNAQTLINNGAFSMVSANQTAQTLQPSLTNNGIFTVSSVGIPLQPTLISGLNNNGVANFNTSTVSNGSITNTGTLNIAAGQTLSFLNSYGSASFNQVAGTLNINGTLGVLGNFNYGGGSINGTVLMNGSNPTLYLAPGVTSGTLLINSQGEATLAAPIIPAGVTVQFQPLYSSALQYFPTSYNPALINNGTLTLISANGANQEINTPVVNNNLFTVIANGTPSSPTELESFTNLAAGVANFNTSTAINGSVLNTGTFNIAAGQTVALSQAFAFNQSGGTLNINGTLCINGTFIDYGGTVNGTVNINGPFPRLSLGSSVSTGTFLLEPLSQPFAAFLTSPIIPAGVTVGFEPAGLAQLQIQGGTTLVNNGRLILAAPDQGLVQLSPSLTNNGLLIVSATGNPVAPAALGSLTNTATATANFNASATFAGNLTNLGALNVNVGTLTPVAPIFTYNQAGGTTTIAPGMSLSLPVPGQFLITGGNINIAASALVPGNLAIASLLWPYPNGPINPFSDLAYIKTTPVSTGQTAGFVNLLGNLAPFNIADPSATLTITADLINGSVNKTGPGTLVLNGTEQPAALEIQAGTVTVGTNTLFPNTVAISVANGAVLNIPASLPNAAITSTGTVNFTAAAAPAIHVVAISSLQLGSNLPATQGDIATVDAPKTTASRTLLETASLSFAGTTGSWQGLLDLTRNDLDISSGQLSDVTNQLREGYNNGTWTGFGGITSSAAAADTTHLTALGVIQNNQGGSPLFSLAHPFDGTTPGVGDILVKYTYYGDTNLDGQVGGSDYSRIDSAYLANQSNPGEYTGWFNGDFNYDGVIDGSDYTLMDNAFNSQGASLASEIATPTAEVAAVPEPSSVFLLGVVAAVMLGRRRHTVACSLAQTLS
jgi:fibronectin-binding autotransporter adhesin